ncbi:hypothetical protein EJE23_04565 [Enterobacter chengduensis]|nr:hypothetical protein EJE23_04565 [Enterobacter chengduensis]
MSWVSNLPNIAPRSVWHKVKIICRPGKAQPPPGKKVYAAATLSHSACFSAGARKAISRPLICA